MTMFTEWMLSCGHQIDRVRCYSCGHIYAADRNRIDTTCPTCGSDSYTPPRSLR